MRSDDAQTLLSTPTGSRLYGLSNDASDYDFFTVVTAVNTRKKNGVKQEMTSTDQGVMDNLFMELDTFLRYAQEGHPQALEAMFSPLAQAGDMLAYYRASYHADLVNMRLNYTDLMLSQSVNYAKEKHRRHVLRWSLNYAQACRNNGRFNPMLNASERNLVLEGAANLDTFAATAARLFPTVKESSFAGKLAHDTK